jgi:hypothetical protein
LEEIEARDILIAKARLLGCRLSPAGKYDEPLYIFAPQRMNFVHGRRRYLVGDLLDGRYFRELLRQFDLGVYNRCQGDDEL